MSLRAASLAVPLFIVCACAGDPSVTGLRELRGTEITTWVLRSVQGQPPPVVVADNDFVRKTVLADTIRLRSDGVGERRVVEHTVSIRAIPTGERTYRRTHGFTFTLQDGRFSADFGCPDDASCIAPPHLLGTVSGDALILERGPYAGPLRYERIMP